MNFWEIQLAATCGLVVVVCSVLLCVAGDEGNAVQKRGRACLETIILVALAILFCLGIYCIWSTHTYTLNPLKAQPVIAQPPEKK